MSEKARKRIRLQLMWDRLIAVVEEQAQAILKTAFGSVVREAGDLSTGIYDLQGRMLAQAVTGTPGHVNTMAKAVSHFLERFPVTSMQPGDVFVTNDPWMGTGHLFDFVVVSPAYYRGKAIALFASTCHMIDVGGRGFSAEARSIYEEGVRIPHMKLRDGDRLNQFILSILEANSRNPVEVKGDLLSLITSNDTAQVRLDEMMVEFGLDSLEELGESILEQSYDAMKKVIEKLPVGDFYSEMKLDGYERELLLRAKMSISKTCPKPPRNSPAPPESGRNSLRQNIIGESDSVTSTGIAPTPLGNAVTERPSLPGRAPTPPMATFMTLNDLFACPSSEKGRTQMLPALSAGTSPVRTWDRQPNAKSGSI